MRESPELSIIIVSWNTREMLLDALRTFLPAPELSLEVIVVDNGSHDGSAEAVERTTSAQHPC
ncbi:MAG: glycosyltransferase [Planctomycetota bacterium]